MDWSKFKTDPYYSESLVYWYDTWYDISNKIKNGFLGVNIINIRIILTDIINEYELNKFKSDNNTKIYIKLIEKIISKNLLICIRKSY